MGMHHKDTRWHALVHQDATAHSIDAPEGRQSCFAGGRRWPCGKRATRAFAQPIGSRAVSCEERDRDRQGRFVSVPRAAGKDLNS